MRRKRGSMGMVGLVGLGIIFLVALMFVPEIFGQMRETTNVTGTVYEAPYLAVENVTFTTFTAGLPAITLFIFIIAFAVALIGGFLWIFSRR